MRGPTPRKFQKHLKIGEKQQTNTQNYLYISIFLWTKMARITLLAVSFGGQQITRQKHVLRIVHAKKQRPTDSNKQTLQRTHVQCNLRIVQCNLRMLHAQTKCPKILNTDFRCYKILRLLFNAIYGCFTPTTKSYGFCPMQSTDSSRPNKMS